MPNSQTFNYHLPTRHALIGINVEASDTVDDNKFDELDSTHGINSGVISAERIFGITVTADDQEPDARCDAASNQR
jgi:hypothetical protein